jgi:hypothetical protein
MVKIMKNHVISSLLSNRKLTGGKLAKQFGCHRSLVYRSLDGAGSRSVRVRIAALLGQSPSVLFPNLTRDQAVLDDVHYIDYLRSTDSVPKS